MPSIHVLFEHRHAVARRPFLVSQRLVRYMTLSVVASTACGGGRMLAESPPAPSATVSTPLSFRLRQEPAVDPRASGLMQWVHPLIGATGLECSSTAIGEHALLTAAHCVDGSQPPALNLGSEQIEFSTPGVRACAHGICERAFPEGDYGAFKFDLATLAVPTALPSAVDALARVSGYVPGAFMLSARLGAAIAICGAHADDTGAVPGQIELADSGSSIVAFTTDGTPVVIGVVSHRRPEEGRWFFAPISDPLPWPEASSALAPDVGHFNTNDLSLIEDCP